MEGSPFRDRRFSAGDVRRILRRAAALAEQDEGTRAAERPLTQEEIERLGGELGLPAAAIRGAMRGDAEPERAEKPAEGDGRIFFEGEIEGELPASQHEDVIDAISAAVGDTGRAQTTDRTLTWTPTPLAANSQRALTVTVRARNGKTRVRIDERLSPSYFQLLLVYGGGLLLGAGASVGLHGFAVGALIALLWFVGALLMRAVVRRRRSKELAQLKASLDALVREGTATGAERARGRKRIAAADDTDAETEAEAEIEAAERARR